MCIRKSVCKNIEMVWPSNYCCWDSVSDGLRTYRKEEVKRDKILKNCSFNRTLYHWAITTTYSNNPGLIRGPFEIYLSWPWPDLNQWPLGLKSKALPTELNSHNSVDIILNIYTIYLYTHTQQHTHIFIYSLLMTFKT